MTIRYMNGFDDTVVEEGSAYVGTSGVTGRSGYGLASRRSSGSIITLGTFPTSVADFTVGFAIRPTTIGVQTWLYFQNSAGNTHARVSVTAAGAIELRDAGNTVQATSANGILINNTWTYLEFHVVIANSGGSVECRAGESVVASFTGDTYSSGTVDCGLVAANAINSANTDIDDLVMHTDAYYGDKVIHTVLPSGNGDSSQWVGSDGNSTDNYQWVDESPPNVTDYVASTTSGNKDLYAMGDMPTDWTVTAVQAMVYCQKSDAGTPPAWSVTAKGQSGGTRDDSNLASRTSTTAQNLNSDIYTTDPDGNALTPTRINAMQVGVKIT